MINFFKSKIKKVKASTAQPTEKTDKSLDQSPVIETPLSGEEEKILEQSSHGYGPSPSC